MPFFRLFFKDRSLWYKLTLLSVLPVIIVTAVVAFYVMGTMEKAMVQTAQNKADDLTDLARLSMSHISVIYNKDLLDNFVDGLGRNASITYALVVDSSDDRILAHNDHRLDGQLVRNTTNAFAPVTMASKKSSGRSYAAAVPITIAHKQYATLYIGFIFDDVPQQMAIVQRGVLLAALLTVLVGMALALFMARLISTPIRSLARQAKLAGKGDFDHPIVYKSKDAIGQLADAFNRMLADIQMSQRQLKAINTVADSVYSSLDIQSVADNAVNAMMSYGHYPGVAIFKINAEKNQLRLVSAKGFDPDTLQKAAVLPVEGSLTGRAVQLCEVVSSTDLAKDTRLVPDVRDALVAENLQSVFSVPLLAQGRVLGAMNLIFKSIYELSDFERKTLLSIGKNIGLAIAHAQQMTQIQNEVNERIEMEKALRESEQKYRNLVERANDGIVIIQDGHIRFANPSAVALSGQNPEDFIDQPFTTYLHPKEKKRVETLYKKRLKGADPIAIYETIFVRKDGGQVYAEVNAGRTTYQDHPADLVFIRDITERKMAQKALEKAYDQLEIKVAERTAELAIAKDRAEESDRLKSAFLASMSHELRTPLNSIIGFTGIILQKLVGPLNEEQIKQLTMVQDSAHHLLRLINDVLDLSKIEAGQLAVASDLFDIRDAIDKVVQSVSPMARKKGLQIRIQNTSAVNEIISDQRRVEQILINLINNAIKFTLQGEVTLICETDTRWMIITVKDTGIGIDRSNADKLFKAFQQIETGLSRRFEGTGLGLSICKKLVGLLGGTIQARSNGIGHGAAFSFTLPLGEKRE